MTPQEAEQHLGELVKIDPRARPGHGKHWMRGKIVAADKHHVHVIPSGHRRSEPVEYGYVALLKSKSAAAGETLVMSHAQHAGISYDEAAVNIQKRVKIPRQRAMQNCKHEKGHTGRDKGIIVSVAGHKAAWVRLDGFKKGEEIKVPLEELEWLPGQTIYPVAKVVERAVLEANGDVSRSAVLPVQANVPPERMAPAPQAPLTPVSAKDAVAQLNIGGDVEIQVDDANVRDMRREHEEAALARLEAGGPWCIVRVERGKMYGYVGAGGNFVTTERIEEWRKYEDAGGAAKRRGNLSAEYGDEVFVVPYDSAADYATSSEPVDPVDAILKPILERDGDKLVVFDNTSGGVFTETGMTSGFRGLGYADAWARYDERAARSAAGRLEAERAAEGVRAEAVTLLAAVARLRQPDPAGQTPPPATHEVPADGGRFVIYDAKRNEVYAGPATGFVGPMFPVKRWARYEERVNYGRAMGKLRRTNPNRAADLSAEDVEYVMKKMGLIPANVPTPTPPPPVAVPAANPPRPNFAEVVERTGQANAELFGRLAGTVSAAPKPPPPVVLNELPPGMTLEEAGMAVAEYASILQRARERIKQHSEELAQAQREAEEANYKMRQAHAAMQALLSA